LFFVEFSPVLPKETLLSTGPCYIRCPWSEPGNYSNYLLSLVLWYPERPWWLHRPCYEVPVVNFLFFVEFSPVLPKETLLSTGPCYIRCPWSEPGNYNNYLLGLVLSYPKRPWSLLDLVMKCSWSKPGTFFCFLFSLVLCYPERPWCLLDLVMRCPGS
jgi:hypothetical protein